MITLPDVVPFNDPVTVCAVCGKACCALGKRKCKAAKLGATASKTVPLATIQAAAEENPSYWKPQCPDKGDDIPIDMEEMRRLISWQRTRPHAERQLVAGYLEHELNIDPAQVSDAMAAEWPEEAEMRHRRRGCYQAADNARRAGDVLESGLIPSLYEYLDRVTSPPHIYPQITISQAREWPSGKK